MKNPEPKATSIHFELQDTKRSAFQNYKHLTVGNRGFVVLLKYEIITSLFGNFPGALGYLLRRIFYRFLLKNLGKSVILGRGVTLRHPHKIEIGEGVAINDFAVLDAFGGDDSGIRIGDHTLISRDVVLNSKGGFIEIGKRTNIGMFCIIFSRDCRVTVGNDVLIASYCYLMGGGDHSMERTDIPIAYQGADCLGIVVEDNVWLGAGVRIKDGCKIGRDSAIGTNSFVNDDMPEFSIAVGVPARIIKNRKPAPDKI